MDASTEACDEPDPDHPLAGSISAIDKKSVHRICSGQVVLTLSTAVKELLENSIDAGASILDIKLKDYGSESIEVSDNGCGVHENNFQGLTLKHHTSKLEDFSDLVNVETFGFRGEALSSLCALSNMSIITRHKTASVGTRLEFDHNGKITSQQKQARQVGTSVVLQNLFYTLPVRHKEFQRNLKKEFVKMVQVLNSYCIISTSVRITCTNQMGKGNRSTVVSSKGNVSMLDNISNVFGPKQAQTILEFKKIEPNEEHFSEFGIKDSNSSMFSIEGFVSKCDHGQGRSSTDRQFFFINGRPFDSTKLSKVVNEVYHQYNRHQYPFVVFKISVQKDNVDVNVTPDKRQVFLEGEKVIMATVKASLIAMYEPTTSILHYQNPVSVNFGKGKMSEGSSEITKLTRHSSLEKPTGISSLMKLKRSFSSAFAKDEGSSKSSPSVSGSQVKQRRLDSYMSKYASPTKDRKPFRSDNYIINHPQDNVKIFDDYSDHKKQEYSVKEGVVELDSSVRASSKQDTTMSRTALSCHGNSSVPEYNIDETGDHCSMSEKSDIMNKEMTLKNVYDDMEDRTKIFGSCVQKNANFVYTSTSCNLVNDNHSIGTGVNIQDTSTSNSGQSDKSCVQNKTSISDHQCVLKDLSVHTIGKYNNSVDEEVDESSCEDNNDNKQVTDSGFEVKHHVTGAHAMYVQPVDDASSRESVHFNDENQVTLIKCKLESNEDDGVPKFHADALGNKMDEVDGDSDVVEEFDCEEVLVRKEKTVLFSLEQLKSKWQSRQNKQSDGQFSRAFRATINPAENDAAELELQREIKKDMFSQMEILGQFNLGFIITKLGKDLFIVDQHATDEKYNFETLQRDYVIQSQKLICPMNLELTSSSETILMDNIDIFRKNGFEFVIDEEGLPTQRIKLTSTPVSKNWNFGKEDIEEMIFILTDSPGVTCRPSRVRAMFASRACRKSIMIGTTLKIAEMKKLVCHMGDIEQPWNCPHGRPTMRHLIHLDMVPR